MGLSQRAAVLCNALDNFLRSPTAFLLPAPVPTLLRDLISLVADLAAEVEKMKGEF